MKHLSILIAAISLLLAQSALAITVSIGAGSSITEKDRTATFDNIDNGDSLLNYTEDSLLISVDDIAYEGFSAVTAGPDYDLYYGSGGNHSFVTISTTDGADMLGLEFLMGNGYFTAASLLTWEAYRDGVLIASGFDNLSKGIVVGWYDALGFDQLRVSSPRSTTFSGFGNPQAIAIDNLYVDVTTSSAVVPLPASAWLGMSLLGGLACIRKLRRA